ncbi:50S ribosomal protein L4 [Planctomyces sp. SH-PL14]|jgi:large subunit ribosomal protein L4|uniref:50S ribosomal protein L4 n=1 Tax=Planctomyces sp. SH-PL14 TaxID=1632864 RepID=UPI00078C564D|nr:50S ribosomal protein L4 [Planctomyces sp. SH-PL14]AMV21261.1 50S ribosomal protein L4 [Planctomyces sp. SH-PL14]
MISVPVVDMSGKTVGKYEFDGADLADRISKQLLHEVVIMYEANKRAGTFKTKTRSEVAGSKKKLFKQKGTGNARAGGKRSPTRVGGGHAFAKVPRDFGYRMPRKSLQIATKMALLSKFQDGEAIVVDSIAINEPKTKVVSTLLKALGVQDQSCLLTTKDHDATVWRCARNIEKLWVSPSKELNAYDLLHQKRLIVTKDALDALRGK